MNMDVKSMIGANGRILRCAAYVRKSTEDGLELEYNSLDAQYDSITSYVRSQACNGWQLIDKKYSDGGFSGGTMDRPGLKSLLDDVKAGLVDIVVVYKIDRLSRSLPDFADLSKLFDQYRVSFVSVTQQIDTSTAAGRMMLNILMSFSQFEREMSADRIRDKIHASKVKGLWVGGCIPYGYKIENKKLVPDPETAPNAVKVFELYARYGELKRVTQELNALGILRGKDQPWRPRSVYTAIHNLRYIGQTAVDGEIVKADHEGIIPLDLWERVQKRMAEQPRHGKSSGRKPNPQSVLMRGLVFCGGCGSAMRFGWCASTTSTTAKRYSYYECIAMRKLATECKVRRVPSALLEAEVDKQIVRVFSASLGIVSAVAKAAMVAQPTLLSALAQSETFGEQFDPDARARINHAIVHRIDVFENSIEMQFNVFGQMDKALYDIGEFKEGYLRVIVPVTLRCVSGTRRVYRVDGANRAITTTTMAENPLLTAVVRSFTWTKLVDSGKFSNLAELADMLKMDRRFVERTLRLATLSPRIIRAILTGNEPDGLSLEKIRKVQTDDWAEQERQLGFK